MGVLGGVGLVYDERMCAHENLDDPLHPEQPARITSIFEALEGAGIVDRCERVEARDATPSELESVHTRDHIAKMCAVGRRKLSEKKRKELSLRDSVYFNEGSSSSALLAAGSVVEVALRVARGDLKAGAAVVRPPGHHAEAGAAMGFCLFNNVAVAAHVLVHGNPDLGVRKVLIVDWDVHHGNGTQHMFWRDPQVLYFSVHRYDSGEFYPKGADGNYDKIGEASGAGFNINVPWPQGGFGDLDYLAVFDDVLIPVAQEFKPDLILVSGGFDSATGDPLGGCEVTPGGYSHMTKRLMGLANGRLVLALEGGYNLKSISESYLACMKVLLEDKPDLAMGTKHQMSYTTPLVKEIRRELQKYWLVLSTQDDAESITNVTEIPPNEVEEFSVAAYAALVQGSDEVNCLVEAFNKSVSLDPESNEVTAGCLVGKSLVETKEGNAEENSGLGGPQAAGTGEVSSSGSSEVGFSPVQEPRTSNQVAVETTGQTVIIGEHSQVNGMDGYADQQRLTQDAHVWYVWYACYASNLLLARFMCYIKGGQVAGMGKVCIGSRNQTPPVDSRWVMVPYHMFFGHSWTRTWQSGGVAFLDPISHGGAPATHVRLYKITTVANTVAGDGMLPRVERSRLQQFQDVLVQENGGDPYSSNLLFEWDHINKLRDIQSASSHATLDILKEAWYGTVKYLGEEDGLPMATVTCSTEHMQKFRKGHFKVCRPSESYSRVILQGLLEQKTFSEEECKAYIASKSKGLPEDANAEKS